MHDRSVGDRSNFIERIVRAVAMDGANVDAFVEAGVNDTNAGTPLVPAETVGAALPWFGIDPFEIAIGVHVKLRGVATEDGIVIRSQNETERLALTQCGLGHGQKEKRERKESHDRSVKRRDSN